MRLSRRGLILGGSAMLAGCASARATPIVTAQAAPVVPTAAPSAAPAPAIQTANLTAPPLDPRGRVRKDLMERAMAALDIHHRRLPLRDRMYLVDFQKFSGDERLYEVDLEGGQVTVLRTCHGRGSDPSHTGYAQRFSNTPDSNMSSGRRLRHRRRQLGIAAGAERAAGRAGIHQ
ncbi:murein L,D-transpeptidase catalytic domain-containing protein [Brevundimonas albigilva]|uniref:murein L,D-transpeptidase catalytic domain-containing protein n=1 Tax=Brevundimonas albigilva TaxID=1312364 RepID=UPI0024C0C397|nr:murein L,D-transpeptidase catalytic domain family protein [Brevundimonas albigilva]